MNHIMNFCNVKTFYGAFGIFLSRVIFFSVTIFEANFVLCCARATRYNG